MLGVHGVSASTSYGDLNNFDTVNDTGLECHGFQIEIDGVHSTDITYTYDWNHYGPPRITEDNSDPVNPKVFIRYESRTPDAYTAIPTATLGPTDGHFCTDPTNYSYGCEHFGVGFSGTPTSVKYNWLHNDGSGNLVLGAAVNVATPSWTYVPPAQAQPAQVVAVIPAPVVPVPAGKRFGEPSWVKVIKTTTHNAVNVALGDLVSDVGANGLPMWQNNEPAEVESEWKLLQANDGANPAKAEALGLPDDMGDGSETVTRRYEFYKYSGNANTIDGENGEAKCDEANPTTDPNAPDYLHGIGNNVSVTDASGVTQYVDCSAQVVVGAYIGAQMAGFDAEAPLGLVDHLQDGELSTPYTPRTVVVGGNSPYTTKITQGSLPPGLAIAEYVDPYTGLTTHGVLSGAPTSGGNFSFTVQATDANGAMVSQVYTMRIAGNVVLPQHNLSVSKSGFGTVSGSGIDCGAACSVLLDEGTAASLTATPAAGSVFTGWSGACTGTGACTTTMSVDKLVTASFVPVTQQYTMVVTKSGSGTVTSSPKGISCGKQCSKAFTAGTNVTLTATPAKKHQFLGWTGGACSGTSLTCTAPMLSNQNVQANFN